MRRNTATRATCVLAATIACLVVPAMLAWACETPVYRYAMYRWQPAPYEVYFLHAAPASEAQRQMQEQLSALARDKELPANVLAFDVNLAEEDALERVPADVKKAWLEQPDRKTPACLVTSPLGIHVFTGPMEEVDLKQLVDSPVRQALGKQLADGKAGVMLLLQGTDPAANEAARQLLNGVARDIASGKVNLYSVPAKEADPETSDKPEAAAEGESGSAGRPQIGLLEVGRDDPAEKWLIRTLLAVEDDLAGFSEPMVFPVYGRARVLPPFIGKGISRQNLMECVEFITGACSCTVKDQNPGVDLLVQYDWDTAAAALAEKVGAEEGNERQFGGDDFFPELIVPRSGADTTALAGKSESGPETGGPETAGPETAGPETAGPETAGPETAGSETPSKTPSAPPGESPSESPAKVTTAEADPVDNKGQAPRAAQDSAVAAADHGQSGHGEPEHGDSEHGASSHGDAETPDGGEGVADATVAARSQTGSTRPTPAEAMDAYVSTGGMVLLGGGFAAALLVLFVATYIVLRPR